MLQLAGIYVPLLTPFNEDQTVNWANLEAHIERLIAAGVHGIFALGSTSEAFFLPLNTKKEILQHIVRTVRGRTPIIVQTGSNVLSETIELSKYALDQGIEVLSVITPYYYSLQEWELVGYYRYLSKRLPNVPFCVYNFASRTRNDIHPALLKQCKSHVEQIVAIKESSESLERFSSLVTENPDVAVFAGTNALILDALSLGCVGAVATLANVLPEMVTGIYESFTAGKLDTAHQLQDTVAEVRSVLKSLGPDLQVYKLAASVFGSYPFEGMYLPHQNLDPQDRKVIMDRLVQLQGRLENHNIKEVSS